MLTPMNSLGALNLGALKKIVSAAALAGLLAGLLLTGIQELQVNPIILKAEVYEDAAAIPQEVAHLHSGAEAEHHEHAAGAWQPANGWERTVFTALANISLAVGLGLLVGAGISLRDEESGWRAGLLWGVAGYLVFFVAPSLGLPPALPGTNAALLVDRQIWWMITVLATVMGLALLIFAKNWKLKIFGAVLLVVPHILGAPQPQVYASAAPAELARTFIYATAAANAAFWLALGGLMGFFYKKFS